MHDLTEPARKRPLYVLLALTGMQGFIEIYWGARQWPAPLGWSLVLGILSSYTTFVWYVRDSDARHYRRSLLRNIGFNALSLVFVPWYMVRSRGAGQKWRALLRLAGFCFLLLTAAATGMMLASLAAWLA
jgi:hypothetical protein